jgi:hypothetical protein
MVEKDKVTMEKNTATASKKPPKEKKPLNLARGSPFWITWISIESFLFILLGILAIVYSNSENLRNALLPIIGSFLVLDGAMKILTNFLPVFAADQKDAAEKAKIRESMAYDLVVGGAMELSIGISLIVVYCQGNVAQVTEFITNFLVIFLSIVLMVGGASLLMFATAFLMTKLYRISIPIYEIVGGVLLIASGIVMLTFFFQKADAVQMAILIIAGLLLILIGIAGFLQILQIFRLRHAATVNAKKEALLRHPLDGTPKEGSASSSSDSVPPSSSTSMTSQSDSKK